MHFGAGKRAYSGTGVSKDSDLLRKEKHSALFCTVSLKNSIVLYEAYAAGCSNQETTFETYA